MITPGVGVDAAGASYNSEPGNNAAASGSKTYELYGLGLRVQMRGTRSLTPQVTS